MLNRVIFWFGAGLVVFGLGLAVLGHDTPTQIRGIAEMIVGYKLLDHA